MELNAIRSDDDASGQKGEICLNPRNARGELISIVLFGNRVDRVGRPSNASGPPPVEGDHVTQGRALAR